MRGACCVFGLAFMQDGRTDAEVPQESFTYGSVQSVYRSQDKHDLIIRQILFFIKRLAKPGEQCSQVIGSVVAYILAEI